MSSRPHVNVLSLFDCSGAMVHPWREAGYSTLTVDLQPARHDGPSLQADLSDPSVLDRLPTADIIFAFPPCTDLASSGARWWAQKEADNPGTLRRALWLASAAHKAASKARTGLWLLENPIGRLSTNWRKPDWKFDPCDYAGFADNPAAEAYTKRTCIWGTITKPPPHRVDPALGSRMHRLPDNKARKYLRSVTPQGFARAVFAELHTQV